MKKLPKCICGKELKAMGVLISHLDGTAACSVKALNNSKYTKMRTPHQKLKKGKKLRRTKMLKLATFAAFVALLVGCNASGPTSFDPSIPVSVRVGVSAPRPPFPQGFDLVRSDENGLIWLDEARATGAEPIVIVGYWSDADPIAARCARAAATGAMIEVWNEPNIGEFWGYNAQLQQTSYADPDPVAYVELLRQCREAAPSAVIMGPALGGSRWDWSYLQHAVATGMMRYLDVVSVHGYATSPKSLARDMARVRQITGASRVGISEWGLKPDSHQDETIRQILQEASRAGVEFVIFFHAPANSNTWLTDDSLNAIASVHQ